MAELGFYSRPTWCYRLFSALFSSFFKETHSSLALPWRHAHNSRADWRISYQRVRFNDSHIQRQKPFREPRSWFLIWFTSSFLLRSEIQCSRPQGNSLQGDHGSLVPSPEMPFALQDAQEPQKCPVLQPTWACLPTWHLNLRQHYGCPFLSSLLPVIPTPHWRGLRPVSFLEQEPRVPGYS